MMQPMATYRLIKDRDRAIQAIYYNIINSETDLGLLNGKHVSTSKSMYT